MRWKALLAAAMLGLGFAAPASAAPVEIDFENIGSVVAGIDSFSGTIFGLNNEDGTYTPSAIELNVRDRSQYTLTTEFNGEVTFLGGRLVDISIAQTETVFGQAPLFPGLTFRIAELSILPGDLERQLFDVRFSERIDSNENILSGAPEFTIRELAAVPLPAGAILLLTGLCGLVAVRRRGVGPRRAA